MNYLQRRFFEISQGNKKRTAIHRVDAVTMPSLELSFVRLAGVTPPATIGDG
jgi:hypothetical protein